MQNIKNINGKQNLEDKFVVLLAEEHPLTSRIQQKSLAEGGFLVLTVKTKEELLHTIKSKKIDLLMLDVNFNNEEGLSFISKIKTLSNNKQIKIILTSVVSVKDKINFKIKDKIDRFIIKPMSKEKLIEELKKLTSQNTRKVERFELGLDACITVDKKEFHSKIIDLSSAGLHIEDKNHKLDLEIGFVLNMAITFPIYKHPIYLTATVVRITKEGFGLKISSVTKEGKRRIVNFIHKYSVSQHAETYYL